MQDFRPNSLKAMSLQIRCHVLRNCNDLGALMALAAAEYILRVSNISHAFAARLRAITYPPLLSIARTRISH
jgi:hypothetical protein